MRVTRFSTLVESLFTNLIDLDKIMPVEAVTPTSSDLSRGKFTSGIKVLGTYIPSQKSNSKIRSYPAGGETRGGI